MKEKRKEKKYNHQEMAEILEISRPYYTKIELGKRNPTLELSIKIKNAVDYYDDDLFINKSR